MIYIFYDKSFHTIHVCYRKYGFPSNMKLEGIPHIVVMVCIEVKNDYVYFVR